MTRTRAEVERAIELAVAHAWAGHGWQGMDEKLGIDSERQLREHIIATVWGARTECFIATYDREIYYNNQVTNTLVILNYRRAGTCLVTSDGPRAVTRRYQRELDRFVAIGNDADSMSPTVSGGIRALHPGIGEPPAELPRLPLNDEQTPS